MEAIKLAQQWRSLAGRFRRIAGSHDCDESHVRAAAAVCGPVLPRMRDAGLIPANLILEPSAEELQKHAEQPDAIAYIWSGCWMSFVSVISHPQINPGFPIPNPLAIKSEHRGGPMNISVGSTDKSDWRIRAENYAAACDWLAETVDNQLRRVSVDETPEQTALAYAMQVAMAAEAVAYKCDCAPHTARLADVLAEADRLWNALAWLQKSLADSALRKRLAETHGNEAVSYAGASGQSYVEAIFSAGERRYMTINMLCQHGVLFPYVSRLHPTQAGKFGEQWPKLPAVDAIEFQASHGGCLRSEQHLLSRICQEIKALPAVDAEHARPFLEKEIAATKGQGGESQPAGLDRNNVAVLFCLSNREPILQTLDDIVVSAKVSRDTASKALKELIDDGLAYRPKGKRMGATVTDKGRMVAAQISR